MVDSTMPDSILNDHNDASSVPVTLKLDQFLKLQGLAATGGQAKLLIQDGLVSVNGTIETRRGRKLIMGDRVSIEGQTYTVDASTFDR